MGQRTSKEPESGKNQTKNYSKNFSSLEINPPKITISRSPNTDRMNLPLSRHYSNVLYGKISFNKLTNSRRTKGGNDGVETTNCFVTCRNPKKGILNGYAFTSNNLKPGDGLVIKVISDSDPSSGQDKRNGSHGHVGLGFTSFDPKSLCLQDLPTDPHDLVDRPEYWVFDSEAIKKCKHGDEFCIKFELSGEIRLGQNGEIFKTLMHVDNSIPLWSFLTLAGSIIGIRLLGKICLPNRLLQLESNERGTNLMHSKSSAPIKRELSQQQHIIDSVPSPNHCQQDQGLETSINQSINSLNPTPITSALENGSLCTAKSKVTRRSRSNENVTRSKSTDSKVKGEQSVSRKETHRKRRDKTEKRSRKSVTEHLSMIQIAENGISNLNAAVFNVCSGESSQPTTNIDKENAKYMNNEQKYSRDSNERDGQNLTVKFDIKGSRDHEDIIVNNGNSFECIICCEKQVDTVFLPCGHICLCVQCASVYWEQNSDNGLCLMCRRRSTGFIRTFTM